MNNGQILEYVKTKVEYLKKEKDHVLDLMLELKSYENDEILKHEYLKLCYSYDIVVDIYKFIESKCSDE